MIIELCSGRKLEFNFYEYNPLVSRFMYNLESNEVMYNKYLKILELSDFYTLRMWNGLVEFIHDRKYMTLYHPTSKKVDYTYVEWIILENINAYYKILPKV